MNTEGKILWGFRKACLTITLVMLFSTDAMASDKTYDFRISISNAEKALKALALRSKSPLLYPYNKLQTVKSNDVYGNYTIEEALDIMLRGTGLKGGLTTRGVITISPITDKVSIQEEPLSKFPTKKKLLETASVAIIAGSSSIAANAQDAEAPITTAPAVQQTAQNTVQYDEVIATGSRIRRKVNEMAATPLQTLDPLAIETSGANDLADVVAEIPGVDLSLSAINSTNSTQNNGLSTIDLRRLGSSRTLTLINGRRAISNSGNGERISLSTIPSGFVKSVEITTGGASAIYGSDAIAGVANIVLKDDFEGLELEYRHDEADASGGVENKFNATAGTQFLDGRGHVMVGGSYRDKGATVIDSTRPEALLAVEWSDPNAGSSDIIDDFSSYGDCDTSGAFCINPGGLTSTTPGGRFESGDAYYVDGVLYNDESLLRPDGRPVHADFITDIDGYNDRVDKNLSSAQDFLTLGLSSTLDFSERFSGYLDISHSTTNTDSFSAPQSISDSTQIGFGATVDEIGDISRDSPFIPAGVEEVRSGDINFRRRTFEVGNNIRRNNRKTLRTAFGFKGDMLDTWQWDVHATYGQFAQRQDQLNEVNAQNVKYALDIREDGRGGYECVDATARANGCVPINLFGPGSISTAAADYIRANLTLDTDRSQYTAGASFSGDLYELPAGTVRAVFGGEYRKEVIDVDGGADSLLGLTTGTPIPTTSAKFDVVELFGELDVPIIEDKLSLQLAGRGADYSTVGTVFSYNIGGSYFVSDAIRLRGQFSRSQRAPTLTEFFSPPRGDSDTVADPCRDLEADGTGITDTPDGVSDPDSVLAVITANCMATPEIAAFFLDNPGDAFDPSSGINGPNTGNNKLTEETGTTFTIGTVIQPSFVPDLTFIVDYYDISVKDAISSIDSQLVADLCLSDPTGYPNNRFCDQITRNPSTGQIDQIINPSENLNEINRSGIDMTVKYDWEFAKIPGEFGINIRGTHYLKDETVLLVGDPIFEGTFSQTTLDGLGEIDKPKDEFRGKLSWNNDSLYFAYTLKYRSGGVESNIKANDPNSLDKFSVGSQAYHDIYGKYTFKDDPRMSVYAGVKNLLDDHGPLVPSGVEQGDDKNIISEINDAIGRRFYIGLKARF